MPDVTVLYSTNEPLGSEVKTATQDLGQFRQGTVLGGWVFLGLGLLLMAAKFLPTLGSSGGMNFLFVIGLASVLGSVFLFTLTRSAKPLFLTVYENGVALRGSDNVENYAGAHINYRNNYGIRNAPLTEARFLWSDVIAFRASDSTPVLGREHTGDHALSMGGRATTNVADSGGIHRYSFVLRPQNGASQPIEVEWLTATVHKDDTVAIVPLLNEKLGSLPPTFKPDGSANAAAI